MSQKNQIPEGRQFRFRADNFTQIPNEVLNLVLDGKIRHRDLTVYAYLLAKAAVAKIAFNKPYLAVPLSTMVRELGIPATTLKDSVKFLSEANIIERIDTPGYTRTIILLKVADGKIVRLSATPKKIGEMPTTKAAELSKPGGAEQAHALPENGPMSDEACPAVF